MKTKMTHAMRMDFAHAIRDRYAAAANKDKRRILEEFIAATGYHEQSAIRVLNRHPESKSRQTRHRPSLYGRTALELLVEFQARDPGQYSLRQLHTLQKRVRAWRQQAVQRLIGVASSPAPYIAPDPSCRASG